MKILAIIAIIMALIAAFGVVFLIWAMAWTTFETTDSYFRWRQRVETKRVLDKVERYNGGTK